MSIDDEDFAAIFIDEALDTLGRFERACLDLEQGWGNQILDELFRAAHNLKGAAASVGFEEVGNFVHKLEDVVTVVKRSAVQPSAELMGLLLSSQVLLMEWVERLRVDRGYIPDQDRIRCLTNQMEHISLVSDASLHHNAPGAFVPFEEAVAEEPEKAAEAIDELEVLFTAAQEEYQLKSSQKNSVVPAAQPQESGSLKREVAHERQESQSKSGEGTLRISAKRLDELIQLVGELSIHEGILYESRRTGTLGSRSSLHALQLSHKIVRELHEKALSLRMHPLRQLFQRLERVARDVARAQGKSISVTIAGEDTELDKTVIEQMSDPLVHVIRNAVDHGIENQSDRESAGKPPIATIHLEAFSDPSGVTICVKDDGRGLNERKILEKALERGLLGEAEEPSRSEIQRMIFMAGFSTADAVSDISGRGVGMDVVLRAIESLRGEIGIESEQGVGTAFRITLPTSLSIVDALVVRVAQTRYAVPVHDLTEIIDLGSYIVERTGEGNSTLSLRGSAVPVYELRNFVDRHDEDAHGSTGSDPALVIRLGDASVAFVIDEVVTQQQVVVRPLSDKLKGIPGVSGCTILGDGEPGMILSLQEIARQCLTH